MAEEDTRERPFEDEFADEELSEEDLAVLRAFEAMDEWPPASETSALTGNAKHEVDASDKRAASATFQPLSDPTIARPGITQPLAEFGMEMLGVFLSEAQEGLSEMQQTLKLLESDEHIQPSRFHRLQRLGHKLRGTAGAMDFSVTATLAGYIEDISEMVVQEKIFPLIALPALMQTVAAVALCLDEVAEQSKEPDGTPLYSNLQAIYRNCNIHLSGQNTIQLVDQIDLDNADNSDSEHPKPVSAPVNASEIADRQPLPTENSSPVAVNVQVSDQIQIEPQRFTRLFRQVVTLAEQRSPLENAQANVTVALQELQAAQKRLQQLELKSSLLLHPPISTQSNHPQGQQTRPIHPSSSLIARILHEAEQQRDSAAQLQAEPHHLLSTIHDERNITEWDELNMERYSEKDLLLRSLREAITDVSIATAHLATAYEQLTNLQNETLLQVKNVWHDTLCLRLVSLSTLVTRLQQVIAECYVDNVQTRKQLHLEVEGGEIEVDQAIFEPLASLLVQLLRQCLTDTFEQEDQDASAIDAPWVHLSIHELGPIINCELSFSMGVRGGAIDALSEALRRLNAQITPRRTKAGGLSLLLSLTRSLTSTQCLFVSIGNQRVVIPATQILQVSNTQYGSCKQMYELNTLLNFPTIERVHSSDQGRPYLLLPASETQEEKGVLVDEVIGVVEFLVRPLQSYLRRTGVIGVTRIHQNHPLLLLDLPALVEKHEKHQKDSYSQEKTPAQPIREVTQTEILLVDDAIMFRQSIHLMLAHAGFVVQEARDGMDALDKLKERVPDICILDVEMPYLNGYDVLNILHDKELYSGMKIIMLTSRSSNQHRQHAFDLGAHAYLTKPCTYDELINTIRSLLALPISPPL